MSAIAQYCVWNKMTISGSDRSVNTKSTEVIQHKLTEIGCRIFPQDGSGIDTATGAIVLSSAIEDTNPDLKKARQYNIPVFHRSEVLAAIVNTKKTFAIAGTNGKSTVTGLIFHLLASVGKNPSLIGGGNLHELHAKGYIGNAYFGTSELLVIEADESDGSLVQYRPYISLFLNLSKDHKPETETLKLFTLLASQSENVWVNYHDDRLRMDARVKTFGFDKRADYYPDRIDQNQDSVRVCKNGFWYEIPYPGHHMIQNLIACLSICSFLNCPESLLSQVTQSYKGLQRRFDVIPIKSSDIRVIDDYAHNPDKISATIQTVQNLSEKVFVLYQPHGFSPTKFLFKELVNVFIRLLRKNDELYLLPIYYAGGTIPQTISSKDLIHEIKKRSHTDACFAPSDRNNAIPPIVTRASVGDVVLSMGARDPSLPAFAQEIAIALEKGKGK